jgi:hypothetical protein
LTGWVLSRRKGAAPAEPATGPLAEQRCVVAADGKTLRARHEVACGEWITAEEVPLMVT